MNTTELTLTWEQELRYIELQEVLEKADRKILMETCLEIFKQMMVQERLYKKIIDGNWKERMPSKL